MTLSFALAFLVSVYGSSKSMTRLSEPCAGGRCIDTQPQPSTVKVMTFNIAWENTKSLTQEELAKIKDQGKDIFMICQQQLVAEGDSCQTRVANRIRIHLGLEYQDLSRSTKVDILGLQEVTFIDPQDFTSWNIYSQVFKHEDEIRSYGQSYHVRIGKKASAGIITLFDSKIFELISEDFGGLGTEAQTRLYLVTYLRHMKSKQIFVVVNVHAPREGFFNEARFVKEIWKKIKRKFPVMNLILLGDFNEGKSYTTEAAIEFFKIGFGLFEASSLKPTCCFSSMEEEGTFKLRNPATWNLWESTDENQAYDHIMSNIPFIRMLPYGAYSKDNSVRNPGKETIESDHLPIVAEIRFNFFEEDKTKIEKILQKRWIKFYFVRHGESTFNHFTQTHPVQTFFGLNFWQHWKNPDSIYVDSPLQDPEDPKALNAGENLSSKFDWARTLVFSSPLRRAKDTAKLIVPSAAFPNRKIIVHPRLTEITGFSDGRKESKAKEGEEEFDEISFPVELPLTWEQFGDDYTQAEYFQPLFHDMINKALEHKDSCEDCGIDQIVIVGHSQWFKALAKLIADKKLDWLESSWKKFAQDSVDNADIVEFEYDYTSNIVENGGQQFWNRFYCHPKLFKPDNGSGESVPKTKVEVNKARI